MTDIAAAHSHGGSGAAPPPLHAKHILAGLTKNDQRVIRNFTLRLVYTFLTGKQKNKWVKLADASPFSGNDDAFASNSNKAVL